MSAGIDPLATLGALVAERPVRAALFERLGLDYCCGGGQTLERACAERDLALGTVQAALEVLDAHSGEQTQEQQRDWSSASLRELSDHIVGAHHARLREELPRIDGLAATAARVHGAGHPQLREAQQVFARIRAQLETHMDGEEDQLFPALVGLEQHGAAIAGSLLDAHEEDHRRVGDGLAALRALTAGYNPAQALCGTHAALLQALAAFEADLHRHIHEENNILLPRARQLAASRSPAHDSPEP